MAHHLYVSTGSAPPAKNMQIEVAAVSDVGRRRQINADGFLLDELAGFCGVADGMGDTPRSRTVARAALEAVRELFLAPWSQLPSEERSVSEAAERFLLGIMQANARLHAPGRTADLRVGTTFAGIAICGDGICVAHVGDSRVGLVRQADGRLHPLTVDHTVLGEALGVDATPELVEMVPNALALTRVIGRKSTVAPSLNRARWEPGDVLVLSTDGVTDWVKAPVIERVVGETPDMGQAAQRLVDCANEAGGRDNATVVLVRWIGGGDEYRGPGSGVGARARRDGGVA